jgi:hypothetical protein
MRSQAAYMVKFCLGKAAVCRRVAELTTDPIHKLTWLKTEGQWFYLARSYDNERREEGRDLLVTARRAYPKESVGVDTHRGDCSEPRAS